MGKLIDAEFSQLFKDEEFDAFKSFLSSSALGAGSFFLAFPTTDNMIARFHYVIDRTKSSEEKVFLSGYPTVYISATELQKPEGLEDVPVWWITSESTDEQEKMH